jgi:hypothetical protein
MAPGLSQHRDRHQRVIPGPVDNMRDRLLTSSCHNASLPLPISFFPLGRPAALTSHETHFPLHPYSFGNIRLHYEPSLRANRLVRGQLVVNSVLNTEGKEYGFAFVEFGEQGSFRDTTQLHEARRLLRETRGKVLLVMYLHGWHNHAKSKDVERFERFLAGIARFSRASAMSFVRSDA